MPVTEFAEPIHRIVAADSTGYRILIGQMCADVHGPGLLYPDHLNRATLRNFTDQSAFSEIILLSRLAHKSSRFSSRINNWR